MAKKKRKKKSKRSKKTRRKKSKKIIRSRKKSRKIKKSRKVLRPRKKTKKPKKKKKFRKKTRKARRIIFKAPSYSKDSDGNSVIKVSDSWANHAYVNDSKYKKKYKMSIKENDKFWAKEGKRITWMKKYTKIKDVKYSNCLLYTSDAADE